MNGPMEGTKDRNEIQNSYLDTVYLQSLFMITLSTKAVQSQPSPSVSMATDLSPRWIKTRP